MTYDLAKKLKDAGFPQGTGNYICPHSETTPSALVVGSDGEARCPVNGCQIVFEPTLSELIEACSPFTPDEFYLGTQLDFWEATWINHTARKEDDKQITVSGSTPLEAVAHLFLALNSGKITGNGEPEEKI